MLPAAAGQAGEGPGPAPQHRPTGSRSQSDYNAPRAVSLCSERSISHSIPSLELDTILEETFCSVEV
uniref:Uncharacterized protein n=2 Tax=gambiae species complex TaxID=44542 RepID=A0A453YZA9_ANOGA